MSTEREMRVSNVERQTAADRLKVAMDEGRLDFHEYDRRLGLAYGAVTYGDLDAIFADLPMDPPAPLAVRPAAPEPVPTPAPRVSAAVAETASGMPLALKILWSIWGAVVAINLTVWVLVGVGGGDPPYFWPMWLLVPGVGLLAATAGVNAARAGRSSRPELPPGGHTS